MNVLYYRDNKRGEGEHTGFAIKGYWLQTASCKICKPIDRRSSLVMLNIEQNEATA